MKKRRKAREIVMLVDTGTNTVAANFTNSTEQQIQQTIEHLKEVYGRDFELVRFREVLPTKTKGKVKG